MDLTSSKQISLERLGMVVSQLRSQEMRIVVANGIFDLIHVGHIRYLHAAKEHGDVLIVAINEDASVRYLKGAGRPIVPVEERAEIIAAMECVDYVITFPEIRLDHLLQIIRPDVHAKGTDYTAETVPERDIVHRYGGKVVIVGGPKLWSSSRIFQTVQSGGNDSASHNPVRFR
jgi:rfaE bifunctional protein nucleotidyltransferase chain/domain